MQSEFGLYLELGFDHISDLGGYDHILFIVALCAIYRLEEWRKVAILVTAFTLGHSLTLALAGFDLVRLNSALIEFLIPVTILLTALYNVLFHRFDQYEISHTFTRRLNINYAFALVFGLVHGLGFSNFFRSISIEGEGGGFVRQLFAFNVGVELGQLLIVAIILVISQLAFVVFSAPQKSWNLFVSGAAAGISTIMALERWPF
ncbi:MAG: HupE/UreJ family protein [Saprospiraceae bacterium]|nr:HupE/UreJ family protein [Saprospiraceae bacterium]